MGSKTTKSVGIVPVIGLYTIGYPGVNPCGDLSMGIWALWGVSIYGVGYYSMGY